MSLLQLPARLRLPAFAARLPAPRPLRFFRTMSHIQRIALMGLFTPALLAGGTCGAYYYQMHRVCDAMTLAGLPVAIPTTSHRRILVLSPHCDDETLGAGAYIADAKRAGAHVTVAFLTNGDGFRIAASRSLHEVNVGPADFVRFAQKRQDEAVAALAELGVTNKDIEFLGYPDRGLEPMWGANWDAAHPFQSGFTGHTRSPYQRSYTPHALYCGASLTADLVRLMQTVQPTDILVTHPDDDHPDHFIAAAFAQAALRECQAGGQAWAGGAHLHYYIIHRGDWPLPQGSHPDRPLLPPPGLVNAASQWSVFPASPAARDAKARALIHYESQMAITGRFLSSFVRSNELLADLPASRFTPSVAVAPQSMGGDNVARYVEPSGDLTDLAARVEGKTLYVRVTARGPISRRIRYQINLRSWQETSRKAGGNAQEAGISTPNNTASPVAYTSRYLSVPPSMVHLGADGKSLETRIPVSVLGLQASGAGRCVWVSAQSRWAGRIPLTTIDRTGYHRFELDGSANAPR